MRARENYTPHLAVAFGLTLAILAAFQLYLLREPGRIAGVQAADKLQQVQAGSDLFAKNCSVCHGNSGEGDIGPALNDKTFLASTADATIFSVISSGVPDTQMPAWNQVHGGPLTDENVSDLVAFIRSWEPNAPNARAAAQAGDPARGAKIFSSVCFICHGDNGVGTARAPALNDPALLAQFDDAWFKSTIIAGRPAQGMPTWGTVLAPQQITDLIALIDQWRATAKVTVATATPGTPAAAAAQIARPSNPGGPGTALNLTGNVTAGGEVFVANCQKCHGATGAGGVNNPGSSDGTVPPLNPIDASIANGDPMVFAFNMDLFLEHGSTPGGASPQLTMPAWGDQKKLTPQQIADVMAYVMSLNTASGTPTPNGPQIARPSNPGGPGQALDLTGDPAGGQTVFTANCEKCHGPQGTGGVQNPGSSDGTVPPLNPIDSTLANADLQAFAYNVDLFVEHGSTPGGSSPQLLMPAWGDQKKLSPQQIADVVAYVIGLNPAVPITATDVATTAPVTPTVSAPSTPAPTTSAVATSAGPTPTGGATQAAPQIARPSNPGGPGTALNLTGNPTAGQTLFVANCVKCHGPQGTGGVANPGSDDGTVPAINPIDSTIANSDPMVYAFNMDLFLEHGSTPSGSNPQFTMTAWGDQKKLTPQQIADVMAYVMQINNAAGTPTPNGPQIARPSNPGGPGTALDLTGDVTAGQTVFVASCKKCHGENGTGGVSNPGSSDGTVPALNPIDSTIANVDPLAFAYNVDLFVEHGSTPGGTSPQFTMTAWGDQKKLTPQQIADVIAYVMSLNPAAPAATAPPAATATQAPTGTPAATGTQPAPTSTPGPTATGPTPTAGPTQAAPQIARPSNPGGPGTALNLTGNPTTGQTLFVANCVKCHGPQGTGGVANPGSNDGTVPAINPIDSTIADSDPMVFAFNMDLFLEHGSTPGGSNPQFTMTAWGDQKKLTPQQIADVMAYVIQINNAAGTPTPNGPQIARPSNPGGPGGALDLTGNVTTGQTVFTTNCQKCHGPQGTGGVNNPGSSDGTVPALNPIDDTIKNADALAFAYNVDLFVEHGSTPGGSSPQLTMTAWGDQKKLTDQQIADVIAYVMSLNK